MNIIALIDTRPELPGETIGTVISTHPSIADAFTARETKEYDKLAKPKFTTRVVEVEIWS